MSRSIRFARVNGSYNGFIGNYKKLIIIQVDSSFKFKRVRVLIDEFFEISRNLVSISPQIK